MIEAHIRQALRGHLPGMSQDTKAGNIGYCMDARSSLDQYLAGTAIEACHRADSRLHILRTHLTPLLCRRDGTCTQLLTQNKHIARFGPTFGQDMIGMNDAS